MRQQQPRSPKSQSPLGNRPETQAQASHTAAGNRLVGQMTPARPEIDRPQTLLPIIAKRALEMAQ